MIILLKPEWVILGAMIGISASLQYAENSAGSPEQYCRNVPAGISPLPDHC